MKLKPHLVSFYAIQPENGLGLVSSSQGMHGQLYT